MGRAARAILFVIITALVAASGPVAQALQATVTPVPDPPATGRNVLALTLADDAGQPLEPEAVTLVAFMPPMGAMPYMEERATVQKVGPGRYEAAVRLTMGGTWEITMTVVTADGETALRYSVTTGIPGIKDKNPPRAQAASGAPVVDLGPARVQKIGVRFAEAKRQTLTKELRAVGVVSPDDTQRSEVTLRVAGYVERQFDVKVGDTVRAGTPLFTVYSPELVTAQTEMLVAAGSYGASHAVHRSAHERLKNLGMTSAQVEQIMKSGEPQRALTVTAPRAGTVLEINARAGSAVVPGQVLATIGDLSKTYVVARVFQHDLPELRSGQRVRILPETGAEARDGVVDLVYPRVEEGTGTGNLRVVADDAAHGALRPGTYVDLRIPIPLGEAIAIPLEAVLRSGLHAYVFVDRGEGRLEPREVTLGRSAGDLVEVRRGLEDGERVAASGTFLLSSEAQLRSALPKWKSDKP